LLLLKKIDPKANSLESREFMALTIPCCYRNSFFISICYKGIAWGKKKTVLSE